MASPLSFLLLLLFLSASIPIVRPDLAADKAALVAFRSAVGRTVLSWDNSVSPCVWTGVTCEAGSVTVLRLPAVGLVGSIPSGVFGNLTGLHTLSLRYNALSGPLPADLASCTQLRNLYLQQNRFSGEISVPILSLQKLIRLNLASNQFSGEIPAGLNNLTRLGTLYLENNNFRGSIPDLDLPNLLQFNVSFNNLSGPIPPKLRSKPKEAFLGMSLCGGPLPSCPGEAPSPATEPVKQNNKKKLSGGAIAGIVIGSVVGFLIIVALLYCLCFGGRGRKQSIPAESGNRLPQAQMASRAKPVERTDNAVPMASRSANTVASAAAATNKGTGRKLVLFGGKAERVYDLEDLLRASAEVLGKGTFGTSYKAMLEMGVAVAVKRLKDVDVPEMEFREKLEAVGAMEHPNLVPLRAYYYSKDEKLLVYDYMPMGSLSALIHGNRGSGRTPLDWETRLAIASGAARGISYIHSTSPAASHGNIKSSNVLLNKDSEACISDQGLAQLGSPSVSPTRVASYRAPEVTDARRVSQKADVYSFGILLLELLTGKAPAQTLLNDEGVDLPRWVESIKHEEWSAEVFDLELLRYQSADDEMMQLLDLAMECAAQYPDKRPTMSDVLARIEHIQSSP